MSIPRMSALDPAGPQAERIAWLWDVFLYVSIVVWVLVVAFLVLALVAARRREDPDPLATDLRQQRRMIRVVSAAGAATVITLLGLLFASVFTGAALSDLESSATIHVRITGNQWWWHVEYDRTDPTRIVTTANELHVPVGEVVELELTANDVIHSFWVPSVHGKKDLIPGRVNKTWIRVDEPGTFRGQCGEFCGLEHAKMAITVIAESRAEFDAWRMKQREPAQPPADPIRQRGLQVFTGGPCALCHTITGTSAGGRVGPDLTHVASRAELAAGTLANTRDSLRAWITDPHASKRGVRMPPTQLPAADLDALVRYLEGLR